MRAAGVTDCLYLGMGRWIMKLADAIDPSPEDSALVVDDESRERDAPGVNTFDGAGDRLFHELIEMGRAICRHRISFVRWYEGRGGQAARCLAGKLWDPGNRPSSHAA